MCCWFSLKILEIKTLKSYKGKINCSSYRIKSGPYGLSGVKDDLQGVHVNEKKNGGLCGETNGIIYILEIINV